MGALGPNDFSIVLAISILWLEVAIFYRLGALTALALHYVI
jgi:hypothetical protein